MVDTALLASGTLGMGLNGCIGATLMMHGFRVAGLGGKWLDSGMTLKVLLMGLATERNHG